MTHIRTKDQFVRSVNRNTKVAMKNLMDWERRKTKALNLVYCRSKALLAEFNDEYAAVLNSCSDALGKEFHVNHTTFTGVNPKNDPPYPPDDVVDPQAVWLDAAYVCDVASSLTRGDDSNLLGLRASFGRNVKVRSMGQAYQLYRLIALSPACVANICPASIEYTKLPDVDADAVLAGERPLEDDCSV